MDSLLAQLLAHGYPVLFFLVLLETFGLPMPAAIALSVAGASVAHGALRLPALLACGMGAMLLGDSIMYWLGRYTGWWLLTLLCRLSFNPETCILRSADAFFKRGRTLLMFAKFVPGINTLAPPLAGSMNMRFWSFLRYDLVGTALYNVTFLSFGWLSRGALRTITQGYKAFSHALSWIVLTAIATYVILHIWYWLRAKALRLAPTVDVAEAAADLASGGAVVYDVRSHGYYDARSMRIAGSSRLDPHAFHQWSGQVSGGAHIYLYCTCIRETTSARIALQLIEQGVACRVIRGGFHKWKAAGLPVEQVPSEEIAELPVFE